MKTGLYLISKDIEIPISYIDAEKANTFDKDCVYNLYSQGGKLVLERINFETVKKEYDKYF